MKTTKKKPNEIERGRHIDAGESNHHRLDEENKGGTGPAVPPEKTLPADKAEKSSTKNNNNRDTPVDPINSDTNLKINNHEEPKEETTADEVMQKHVGETPTPKNKFSLAGLKSKSVDAVPISRTRPGTVTVSKPNDDTFIRTSQKPEEWAVFDCIELKSEKKLYLLSPEIMEEIISLNEENAQMMIKTVKKHLIFSLDRSGNAFLWPITIMDGDNDWIDSANVCATEAKENWIRIVSNQTARRYDFVVSQSTVKPNWPSMSYEEAVLKAFDGKIIDSMEHDVIKQLLGED